MADDGAAPARVGIVAWRRGPQQELLVGCSPDGAPAALPCRDVVDLHPLGAALALLPPAAGDVGSPGPHRVTEGPHGPTWWWPVQVPAGDVGLAWRPAEVVADEHPGLADLLLGGGPPAYRQVVLVRHARAGSRDDWDGPDAERGLDRRGREQAVSLSALLAAYRVERIHSSDARRCLETVTPLGAAVGLPVLAEPLLSEDGSADDPPAAAALLRDLVDRSGQAVVCTQRKTLGRLLPRVLEHVGLAGDAATSPRKGGQLVLHLPSTGDAPAVVEPLPPPPA